ncbi:hypothetical protein PO002_27680 [Cupriavidus necator]|uniref:hypothetical protein n=1 Tax=Cupriavidus necator TaxID=106590 RepID=UPI0039C07597
MTKERPILFSGAMVRAILDSRKTQTRRIIKLPPALETLDCSEADAIAEGIERRPSADGDWAHYADTGLSTDARGSYRSLWEQINGRGSWIANPWVWLVEFRRAQT